MVRPVVWRPPAEPSPAELAVIRGAGHLTPLEQPLVASRTLEGFLERAL